MKIIRFIFLLLISQISLADNSYLVAPGHVNFDLTHPETQTFLVLNNGDHTIHIRADIKYYKPSSNTLQLGIRTNSNYNDNLAPHLLISPPILILHPGEQRKLRVSVLPPANLRPGTYRGYVKFSMLEFSKTQQHVTHQHNKALSIAINFHLNTIVSIYGHKGNGKANIKLDCHHKHKKIYLTAINNSPWVDISMLHYSNKPPYALVSLPYTKQNLMLDGQVHNIKKVAYNKKTTQIIRCD